jgi:hypothetical protein
MSNVQSLSFDRVKSVLKKLGVDIYGEDEDGLIVKLRAIEELPHDVICHVDIRRDDVLHVLVESTKVVPESKIGEAIFFCNTWNAYRLWPNTWIKAFLNEKTSKLSGMYAIDLETGVHEELLEDFLGDSLNSALQLYKKYAVEVGD